MQFPESNSRTTYDGEYHLGLEETGHDEVIATSNVVALNTALNEQRSGGSFDYIRGSAGPVLKHVNLAAKEFAILSQPIYTAHRTGGGFTGQGGRTTAFPQAAYESASSQGGMITQITRLWEEEDEDRTYRPIILVRGSGQEVGKLQLNGRRWIFGSTFAEGDRATAGIEVEARDQTIQGSPPVGFNYLHDLTIQQCDVGISALGGYYDITDGELTFVTALTNCDQCTVERVAFFGITDDCFRFDNGQAVGWSFKDISVNMTDSADVNIFNVLRGGDITANNIIVNHRQANLYVQSTNDQNNSCAWLHNVVWDLGADLPGKFFCLYKWAGAITDDMSSVHAAVEIVGDWKERTPGTFDATKIIQVPRGKNFNLSNIRIKMIGMPTTHFTDIGGGFFTPDPAYWAN